MICFEVHGNLISDGLTLQKHPKWGMGLSLGALGKGNWCEFVKLDNKKPPPVTAVGDSFKLMRSSLVSFNAERGRQRHAFLAPEQDDNALVFIDPTDGGESNGATFQYFGEPNQKAVGQLIQSTQNKRVTIEQSLWVIQPGQAILLVQTTGSIYVLYYNNGSLLRMTPDNFILTVVIPWLDSKPTIALVEKARVLAKKRGNTHLFRLLSQYQICYSA